MPPLSRYIAARNQMARVDQDSEAYYVDTVNGNASYDGRSWASAFLTMAAALAAVPSHAIIYVRGKVREQLVAPLGIYGVSIIGADTTPRHDLAASWVPPASPTAATALLKLREQGWTIENLLLQSHTSSPAVELHRAEDATNPDPSHATFRNCRFEGVDGIVDRGGCFNVTVEDCLFRGLTGHAIKCVSTSIANPLHWHIRRNRFFDCTNAIAAAFSKATIQDNLFATITTAVIDLTGGVAPNLVVDNTFNINAADFDPAGGVTGVSGDVWSNRLKDTLNEHGLPAN